MSDHVPAAGEMRLPRGVRGLETVRDGVPVARLGYGARAGFAGASGLTGFIGWYAARDAEDGSALLRQAVELLLDEGAERVIGPFDGSTWHRYRLALHDQGAAAPVPEPFLSEPVNPPDYPRHFESAGFRPHLEYESRIIRHPGADATLESARSRLAARGVEVRGIDVTRFDEALREIHALSLVAFRENAYFTPIGLLEFNTLYAPMRPLVEPELVRLAYDAEGRLLGFVFAFMDPLSTEPRVVLKSLATHPDARGLGLGGLLTEAVNVVAGERGAQVIHALMQSSNFSRRISDRGESELFRRYRLYVAGEA